MDQLEVQTQLTALPSTFLRPSAPFTQLMDAFTAALSRMTVSADGVTSQLTFQNARFGWLDVWGILFGIPRRSNEADASYSARISITLTGGAGPIGAMTNWILTAWQVLVVISENLPNVGYTITFPPIVTTAQINQILLGLAQIRPAGIPFNVVVTDIGTYLQTVNFFNASRVTGQYLGGGATPVTISIPSAYNNSPPLVPELYLTDPTLNPI